MSVTGSDQLQALEKAIMARAEDLAQEFHDKANHQRDNILRDTAERLHLAEEREVLTAKAEAERHFRRVTQASELKMQGQLDQLRWELVKSIEGRLKQQMTALRDDRETYRAWLIEMIREGDDALPGGDLSAEVTAEDLSWVRSEWTQLIAKAGPTRSIFLSEQPTWGSGGIRLRSADNRAQLDNRFEGRLVRLQQEVQRVILGELFPPDIHAKARGGGPQ